MLVVLRGALAAAGSIVFFGTYAVPIKLPWVLALDIDPVVFQAYKSLFCFASSFLVLLYEDFKFTVWGLIGGTVWVINGIAAITAVRLAGIGSAQSLWSGLSIFVSFFWGAYVFKEPVQSVSISYLSLFTMVLGMAGLSLASAAGIAGLNRDHSDASTLDDLEIELLDSQETNPHQKTKRFVTGSVCALFVGVFNGSLMVPLKYAHQDVVGIQYLISFGIGAVVATSVLLIIYSTARYLAGKPPLNFHFGKGAVAALAAGFLWSSGNFCSIYATIYLGMALGWPLVQCQILVSALWASLYFKEVRGIQSSAILIFSTALVVAGAVVLFKFGTVG